MAADDRTRLEQLCRYVIRPPLASGRLRFVDPETLSFALKTPWDDGTRWLLLSPTELLEKFVALVPPPRQNLVRYHGVLAPAYPDRAHIVPGPSHLTAPACQHTHGQPDSPRQHRVAWAKLLARVFQIDLQCPTCHGAPKIVAALTDPLSVRTYLDGVGLPSRAPPVSPARLDRQLQLDDAAAASSLSASTRAPACRPYPAECLRTSSPGALGPESPHVHPRAIHPDPCSTDDDYQKRPLSFLSFP